MWPEGRNEVKRNAFVSIIGKLLCSRENLVIFLSVSGLIFLKHWWRQLDDDFLCIGLPCLPTLPSPVTALREFNNRYFPYWSISCSCMCCNFYRLSKYIFFDQRYFSRSAFWFTFYCHIYSAKSNFRLWLCFVFSVTQSANILWLFVVGGGQSKGTRLTHILQITSELLQGWQNII